MIHFQKSDIKNPHLKPNVTVNLKMKMIVLIGIISHRYCCCHWAFHQLFHVGHVWKRRWENVRLVLRKVWRIFLN